VEGHYNVLIITWPQIAFERLDHVIFISENTKQGLTHLNGTPASKVAVNRLG
jgi:hypothetical protein